MAGEWARTIGAVVAVSLVLVGVPAIWFGATKYAAYAANSRPFGRRGGLSELVVHVDWYTQAEFVRGEEYVDADGELCLVYAGILPVAAVRGLPGITDDVSVTK